MKITVYTVCFNEELMLPHFLNHYSRIADRIVLYDNQSTDQSMSLARAYPNTEIHLIPAADFLNRPSCPYERTAGEMIGQTT